MRFPNFALEWSQKRLNQYYTKNGNFPNDDEQKLVSDWLYSLPETRPKMVNKLYKLTWNDAVAAQEKWHQSLAKKTKKNRIDNFGDCKTLCENNGWSWVQILTPEGLDNEGCSMGHCVGRGAYDNRDDVNIYSLRDANNCSHITVEHDIINNQIVQMKGRGNSVVPLKYQDYTLDLMKIIKPGYIKVDNLIYYVEIDNEWHMFNNLHTVNEIIKRGCEKIIFHHNLNSGNIDIMKLPKSFYVYGEFSIQEMETQYIECLQDVYFDSLIVSKYDDAIDIPHQNEDPYIDGNHWIYKSTVVCKGYNGECLTNCFSNPNFKNEFQTYLYVCPDGNPILRFQYWYKTGVLKQLAGAYITQNTRLQAISDLITHLNPKCLHGITGYIFYQEKNDVIKYDTPNNLVRYMQRLNEPVFFGNMIIYRSSKIPKGSCFNGNVLIKRHNLDYVPPNIKFNGKLNISYCPGNIDLSGLSPYTNLDISMCADINELKNITCSTIQLYQCQNLTNIDVNVDSIHVYECDSLKTVNGDIKKKLHIHSCDSLHVLPDINVDMLHFSYLDIYKIGCIKANTITILNGVIRNYDEFKKNIICDTIILDETQTIPGYLSDSLILKIWRHIKYRNVKITEKTVKDGLLHMVSPENVEYDMLF